MIERATPRDASAIAELVECLTHEINAKTGTKHFNVESEATTERCREFLQSGRHIVYLAKNAVMPVGFVAMCESHALYTEGTFGIIQESFVSEPFRGSGIGKQLLDAAIRNGKTTGWTRLELCTPPLPELEPTLRFYERQGFSVTGGRKMKCLL